MGTLFERYKELNINGSLICLEQVEDIYSYFCYPTNAKAIGFEGSIMYCFVEPYGDMVFACNPDTCADDFVYPLARNFEDFKRLILACGSTNPIGHTIQSLILGPLYLIVIGIPSTMWAFLFEKKRKDEQIPYGAFFAEKWANRLGERVTGEKSIDMLVID